MKLKDLVWMLQEVKPFKKPKVLLEQYPTSPQVAAEMMMAIANQDNSIQGASILDLGIGTGMLSAAALAFDPALLIGVDIDAEALEICHSNLCAIFDEETDDEETNCIKKPNYNLLQADITNSDLLTQFQGKVQTVIMNPPFGTKKSQGIDVHFLQTATQIASQFVYSLHKSSTRNYILKKVQEWGHKGEVMAQLRFDVPAMYRFHKEKSRDIQVDLIKITIGLSN